MFDQQFELLYNRFSMVWMPIVAAVEAQKEVNREMRRIIKEVERTSRRENIFNNSPFKEEEYFNFIDFSRELNIYIDKKKYTTMNIHDETGIHKDTIGTVRLGFPVSLRVVCKLADWADLSLDKYHIRHFGG